MNLYRRLIFILMFIFLTVNPVSAKYESTQNINLNLTVAEYVALELPDAINVDVKVGEDKYVEADFFLRTNCNVNITFKSLGFEDEDAAILNKYVQYGLDGFFAGKKASFEDETFEITPGTYYQGKFSVNWLGKSFAVDEWQNVTNGDYQDTITVTISY